MMAIDSALATIAKYNTWKFLNFLKLNGMLKGDPWDYVKDIKFTWHDLKSPILGGTE